MRPDIEYLERKFEEFNRLYFAGELPPILILMGDSRSALGQFVHLSDYPEVLPRGNGECYMRFSRRFDLPERDVEDTIIHEMIHYLIWTKKLKDNAPHGVIFRKFMDDINSRFNRSLTVSKKLSDSQKESDNLNRSNYIMVTERHSGDLTITACAKTCVFKIHRAYCSSPDVRTISWYWSCDPWFNRFPKCRTPKSYRLSKEEFQTYFRTATPCECDGRVFRPLKRK